MKIKGKCVLITGSAKRGGAELVKTFASAGARVILHCNNSVNDAELLLPTLPGTGHRIIRADFAEMAEVERLISEAGTFDILINNASIFFRPGSPEDINRTGLYHQINFLAPQKLLEAWSKQQLSEACAVNILDQAVLKTGSGGYWQSRYDLMQLTFELAVKLGKQNFRVNAVAPGITETDMMKAVPKEIIDPMIQQIPLRRLGQPEDIANAFVFLASEEASYITGVVLQVDGLARS